MNTTSLGRATILAQKPGPTLPTAADFTTGRDHCLAYLEPLASSELLKGVITFDSQVVSIGRQGLLKDELPGDAARAQKPFRILIRDSKGKERVEQADIVFDCTGTYGQHRWLGDGGIPAIGELAAEPLIGYQLDDICGDKMVQYAGKTVLVVGAGYSAATTVWNLAELSHKNPDTSCYWAVRAKGSQPIKRLTNDPLRERDRLAVRANTLATRADDNVEFHPATVIESIETAGPDRGFKVTAKKAGQIIVWNVDRIVANLGHTPDVNLYRELQIDECYASQGPRKLAAALAGQTGRDCLQQTSCGPDSLRNPEPNFYILGAKSYGRNPQFLLRIGFEQIRDAFRIIAEKPSLDLYSAAKA